jgi:hypothetical protein
MQSPKDTVRNDLSNKSTDGVDKIDSPKPTQERGQRGPPDSADP